MANNGASPRSSAPSPSVATSRSFASRGAIARSLGNRETPSDTETGEESGTPRHRSIEHGRKRGLQEVEGELEREKKRLKRLEDVIEDCCPACQRLFQAALE